MTMSIAGEQADAVAILKLVAPAAGLVLLFVGGFFLYLVKTKLSGSPDREMRERGASLILGPFLRDYFAWLMRPLLGLVIASGFSANLVTVVALALGVASGIAIASGHFALGGWLFLSSGFCDFLDGRLARLSRQASRAGSLLDSVFDRYAEAAVLTGLGWFYRESWILFIVVIAGLGSFLVSYIRARCGELGINVTRVGLLQRPERVAILGTTICLSPIVEALISTTSQPTYHLAITGLAFVAIMSNVTALQRLSSGMRQLRMNAAMHKAQGLSNANARVS